MTQASGLVKGRRISVGSIRYFETLGGSLDEGLARKLNIEMIHDAGGKIYACKASVDMFKLTKQDFCPQVDKDSDCWRILRSVGWGADHFHLNQQGPSGLELSDMLDTRLSRNQANRADGLLSL